MAVTLINVFTMPKEKEEDFLREWTKTATHFSSTDAFIETHLHRNTGIGNDTFSFINIARWTSAEDWKREHTTYRPTEYDIEGVKGHPSIFEAVVDIERDKGADSRPIRW